MSEDMWRGWWYAYQWVLSLFLYVLMKDKSYSIETTNKWWKDFTEFKNKVVKFKKKCLLKYWDDFDLKVEVMVEWPEECLDDITFLSHNEWDNFDNNIFIQVKTKWPEEEMKWTEWIYKSVVNFINNINFQKDKNKGNVHFFIMTNRDVSRRLLNDIRNTKINIYLSFAREIIRSKKHDFYPHEELKNSKWKKNHLIVESILKDEDIVTEENLKNYTEEYLEKFKNLILDLHIVFKNLDIITKVNQKILEDELLNHLWELQYLREEKRVSKLCWEWEEVEEWTEEFKRYQNFKHTYFLPKTWLEWKLISEIDVITKWKFI